MKQILLILAGLLGLWAAPTMAATTYVSQNGGKFSGGTACNGQTAISITAFDSSTPVAGDHIYLCGTLTIFLGVRGSGASGNPITITWDTGAKISLPTCNGFGVKCVDLETQSYIVLDGGTPCGPGTTCAESDSGTGVIEATASGSAPLPNQPGPNEAIFSSGSNIEAKNLIIRNVYQHTSFTDNTGGAGDYAGWDVSGGSNNMMHDCTIHDVSVAMLVAGANQNNVTYYNNNAWNINWGFASGTGGSGSTQTSFSIHDNHFGSVANWDDSSNSYHHDRTFLYDASAGAGNFNGVLIYNNLYDGPSGVDSTADIYFGGGQEQNTYVYNNVLNNFGQNTGLSNALLELTGESTQSVWVYNNTISGAGPTIDTGSCVQLQGTIVFENNAVTGCANLVKLQNGTYGGGSPTISAMNSNSYGNGSPSVTWEDENGTNYLTLAAWRSFTHGELNSTFNAGGETLNLAGIPVIGSLAIGSGVNLTALCSGNLAELCSSTSDGDLQAPIARPSGSAPWDVGAFFSGAGTGLAPTPPTGLIASVN